MFEGHFEVLDQDECRTLLGEAHVGRLGFIGPDGITVLPLAYTQDGNLVVVRTAAHTQLAELPEGIDVAFEVDHVDQEAANGWSVLVRGRLVDVSEELLSPEFLAPLPYVPGDRDVVRAISIDQVQGRAVSRP
ncbi:hypothetical protein GCM10027030_21840 [Luteococcus sediminum]